MREYTNSEIEHLIDEWIHNKRHRRVLKLHFIDCETVEAIAADADVDRTPRQVNRIIEKCSATLDAHL